MALLPARPSLALTLFLVLVGLPGLAQDPAPPLEPKAKATDTALLDLPPLPPEARLKQTLSLGGRSLAYTVTVGALPILDEKGRKVAEVVCTSYTLDGPVPPRRPVTFAMNGGPGSASLWLNLGALGPRRIAFGAQGDAPSDPVQLVDNPSTWLEFTDLVFIDPVGTGYSRALVGEEDARKRFYNLKADIEYLSRIIYDWLQAKDRMASPKYLVGESYGGFRGPRLAATLEAELGVGLTGIVLVSPYLDGQSWHQANLSPMPWVGKLPSLAAARLEREGKLTEAAMAPVEAYARSEYALDLLKGWSDPVALERMVLKVSDFTGLDPAFVRRAGGRIDDRAYLRERFRDQRELGSWYDANRTMPDPFPWLTDGEEGRVEPADRDVVPSSAMVDFLGRTLGWKPKGRYVSHNDDLAKNWGLGNEAWWFTAESGSDLRKVLALDPRLRVLIAHGYTDLATAYFNTKILLDQIPPMGDPGRLHLKVYPGGHMFYARPGSLVAFQQDALALFTGKW